MNYNNTVQQLITAIIGTINTRASIITFNEMIKRYGCKYNKSSMIYNKAVYCVTLDRLMQEYEDNK